MPAALPWGYLLQQAWVAGVAAGLCLLASWLGRRRQPPRVGVGAVVSGCAVMALGLVAGSVLFRPMGGFFLIGLWFYGGGILLPLRVLAAGRQLWARRLGRALLLMALATLAVTGHATLIAPDHLTARSETVATPGLQVPELRIALVTDLQSVGPGAREAHCVELVNAFQPHFVVLGGDYIQCEWFEAPLIAAMRGVIAAFRPLVATVAVTSDSDDAEQRRQLFTGLPVRYLENQGAGFALGAQRVFVAGLEHRRPDLAAALTGVRPDDLLLLVAHAPDPLWTLGPQALPAGTPPPAALLSGHTHGGQLQLPGIGPLVTLSRVPRRVAGGGLFTTPAGWTLVQSRGVGMEGGFAPRFRLLCPPEVVLLRLVPPAAVAGR